MGQEILKDWQKTIISFLASVPDFKNFYLTGGTALAAHYLRHRFSDDLDFFSFEDIDSIFIHKLAEGIKEKLKAKSLRFSRLHDRNQFFYLLNNEEVKIEFSRYPFEQLAKTKTFDGLAVDSEKDIAVNKLAAILDRFDPKDFVDLYFLIPKYPLRQLSLGVEKKFGIKTDPLFLVSELGKVRRIEALPKMIKPLTIENLKDFFAKQIKNLTPKIIEV